MLRKRRIDDRVLLEPVLEGMNSVALFITDINRTLIRIFMPQTSKKLRGILVLPSVHPSASDTSFPQEP